MTKIRAPAQSGSVEVLTLDCRQQLLSFTWKAEGRICLSCHSHTYTSWSLFILCMCMCVSHTHTHTRWSQFILSRTHTGGICSFSHTWVDAIHLLKHRVKSIHSHAHTHIHTHRMESIRPLSHTQGGVFNSTHTQGAVYSSLTQGGVCSSSLSHTHRYESFHTYTHTQVESSHHFSYTG